MVPGVDLGRRRFEGRCPLLRWHPLAGLGGLRWCREPVLVRQGVPFFHDKSAAEFSADVYERYDALVTRQTGLHLADELHGGYPFQELLDYVTTWLPGGEQLSAVDVGCSVGRLAAEMAMHNPTWSVAGIDLSYQMLRQANDYWVKGLALQPNLMKFGFGSPTLRAPEVFTPAADADSSRLQFALAKAEDLPLADASLDVVLNTFLIDRLPNPYAAFPEFWRVLKPGGRLITVTPLNFLTPDGWREAYPPIKILQRLQQAGWLVLDWTDPLVLEEPMDIRGNAVCWSCVAFVLQRGSTTEPTTSLNHYHGT